MLSANDRALIAAPGRFMLRVMRETLTDGTVTLRRCGIEDAEDLFAAARDSITEVHPWLPWCHPAYAIEETKAWLEAQPPLWDAGRAFNFVIRNSDGQCAGGAGLNSFHDLFPFADLSYWVRTGHGGQGIATRAARLLAHFALSDVALQRVEIVVAVGNTVSQRVAEKTGAQREGVLRSRLMIHGVPHDAVMFSFTRADLEQSLADLMSLLQTE